MSDTPTPGEICYAAYRQRLQRGPHELMPWELLARRHQHAWDAAALAVLAWEDVRQKHQEGRDA